MTRSGAVSGCAPMRQTRAAAPPSSNDELDDQPDTIRYINGDVYEGELKDGKRHGQGTFTWKNGDVYEGQWRKNAMHGKGVAKFANGNVYDGEFKDDAQSGRGTYTSSSGDVYEGEFMEGKQHGKGTYKWKEGDIYEGQWLGGKRHGKGVYRYESGDVYDGEWKDGLHHGIGTRTFASGDAYEGQWMRGIKHGRGTMKFSASGNVYKGEWQGDLQHGIGTLTEPDGAVYEGQWKGGKAHGRGTQTYASGNVYDGCWVGGKRHGKGTLYYSSGGVYEGQWVGGKRHGQGTMKFSSGNVYEGDFKEGKQHGKGTLEYKNGNVYEGEFLGGNRHGRGTLTWKESGNSYEGQWVEGMRHGKGVVKLSAGGTYEQSWSNGEQTFPQPKGVVGSSEPNAGAWTNDAPPASSRELSGERTRELPEKVYDEPQLRSQRSQQRRSQVDQKACEHCGADDFHYKLRVCSGCDLALYCSAACQKASSGSHKRICNIMSELPSKDSDRLVLKYDREKMVDFNAGLRYGKKYLEGMKHLEVNIRTLGGDDNVKLSVKRLSSLLRSKKGALDSVFWASDGICVSGVSNDDQVWKELYGLKQLRLDYTIFHEVGPLCDIIGKQSSAIKALCLPFLSIHWSKAKCRRSLALAVSACKHLVKLDLSWCLLTDSDLKIMLQDLPNLRVLSLERHRGNSHEFTDNTCGLIARKCPGLQELNLNYHSHLSVKGIRKIFEGCVHIRSFATTSCKLSCKDVRSLLDIAPQLLCLSLVGLDIAEEELDKAIEATGGRTLFRLSDSVPRKGLIYRPRGERISAKTKEKSLFQLELLGQILAKKDDPEVANEWEDMLES